jgi:uncharacterized tellurite resistance protein B-like protein
MDERQKAIAKAVIQMAHADGEVHPTEREVLDGMLFQLGGNPEELQGAENEPLPALDTLLPEKADRLEAMKLLLQMCMADGRLSFDEFYFLSDVCDKLEISRDEMEQLRDEVVGRPEEA